MKNKKILGMGNAVLDVLISCDDEKLKELKLKKGLMTIVDQSESDIILNSVDPVKKSSGGSVANSIAAIAHFGGSSGFCGRVKNDQLGLDFVSDIKQSGVNFLCEPKKDGPSTARCLVFVTKDGERTMQTYLGASVNLSEEDILEDFFADTAMLFIEGYLWSSESARKAIKKAVGLAKKNKIKVIFSLSDAGLTKAFKDQFNVFISNDVDILIGNNNEFFELFGSKEHNKISDISNKFCEIAVMTEGSSGATMFQKGTITHSNSHKNLNIIDTTGAGDIFAAGFLYKFSLGESDIDSLDYGCEMASKILSQFGARLQ